MGLGSWVVEWLELGVAHEGGGQHSEADVVRAFLHLLAMTTWRKSHLS